MHELLATRGDRAVAQLATRQHGFVSTEQLHGAGLGRGAIHHRVRRGWLHPRHRGVYAVGHVPVTLRGRPWAAVLACGGPDAAALSHRSTAPMWDLLPAPAGAVEVMALGGCRSVEASACSAARRGPRARRRPRRGRAGFTSLTRTLVDLAAVLTPHQLERVCHRAELLHRPDFAAVVARANRRPGARNLRAARAHR